MLQTLARRVRPVSRRSGVVLGFALIAAVSTPPTTAAEGIALSVDASRGGAKIDRNLFGQFAKHGLLGRFIPLDATLGKLPGTLPDSFRPEQAPFFVTQDDANVRPIPLRVDHDENR